LDTFVQTFLLRWRKGRRGWSEGNPQNVANTVRAFATLGHACPSLLVAVEKRATWLVTEGNPQAVANTVWAFATLGHACPNLLDAVEKRATWLVTEGNPLDAAIILWAFAVQDLDSSKESRVETIKIMWNALTSHHGGRDRLSMENLYQLNQFQLASRMEIPGIQLSPPKDALRNDMNKAMKSSTVTVSVAQKEIHGLLLTMGLDAELEVSPFDEDRGGFLSIDIACKNKKLAIEFDGPSHFLSDGTHNGATQLKTRLLKKLGWSVIRIPFQEWAKCNKGQRNVYLRKKLPKSQTLHYIK